MAESYRQKRLKELTGTGNEAGVPSVDANIPYRQRRLMELGFLPDSRPSTQLRQNLPSPMQSGFGGLQNTTLGQAAAGNPSAAATYRQATGITLRPNDDKVRQQRENEEADKRARDFFGSRLTDNFLIPARDFIDDSLFGKSASRVSLSAANALNLYPDDNRAKAENRPTTGSKVFDTTLDIGGALGGYASNPAGVGVAGQSLLTGPYRIADNLLATRAGMRLQNAVASPLSRVVSTPTANMIANQALRGGGAGALQGAAQAGIQGDASTRNILQSAALGAGLGAVGDVAISGLGSFIRSRVGNRSPFVDDLLPSNQAQPASSVMDAPVTRVDAASKTGIVSAYDQLPAFMRRNLTPEDVTRLQGKPAGYNFDTTNGGTLALPQGNAPGATVARSQVLQNPYRTRFENLIADAQANPTIKNVNDLEQYWASIAGREDPTLDKLIELAYPPARPNRVTTDLLQKARTNQAQREVYGVPLPVRSASERIASPSVNSEAILSSRTGVKGSLPQRVGGKGLPSPDRLEDGLELFNPAAVKADDYVAPKFDVEEVAPSAANPLRVEDVTPTGEQIIKPTVDGDGVGFLPFRRTKMYENLSTTTKSQLVSRRTREPRQWKKTASRLYTNFVDDLNPVNDFVKMANDTLQRTIETDKDPYRLALSSRGSDMIAKQITTEAFVDQNGKVVGESLKDALKDVPANEYVSFEDYLINKHAITRYERGEKVFDDKLEWTPEKGAQIVADYERMFPNFKDSSERLYQFNKNLVEKWLVEPGIISKEQAEAYFKANPYYVPNKRYFTDLERGGRGFSKSKDGFGNQSNPVKKYGKGGSERKIISPIESIIENVDAYVKAANRNRVMQNFVNIIKEKPDNFKGLVEIVDDGKAKRKLDTDKELNNPESEDALADVVDEVTTDFTKTEKKKEKVKRTQLDHDNVVRTLIEGKPVYVKFNDPDLLNAMLAIGPDSSGFMLRVLGNVTGVMKTLTTGINPVFNLTRNVFRDIPQSYVQSKTASNPLQFAGDLFSALVDVTKNADSYLQYKRVGGGHTSSIADNRNMLARSKSQVLPQARSARTIIPRAYRTFEDWMNVVEAAPRLAEFKRSQNAGNSLQKALFDANEITVNFKRRGALSREIDKVFPYWNAAIQGLDKSVRTFKDNPAAALTKSFMAITIPTLVMYAINYNDPNYQKLNNRTKDNFILIPKGDGTFFKIAKPQELGTIFSDIPERLLRKFHQEDPAAFRDFAEQLRTNFVPPGISGLLKSGGVTDRIFAGTLGDTILGPVANLYANRDFADRPIVPAYLQNLSPELQSDAKTSSIGKLIGENTGTSPKQIDYLIRQYSGILGQIALPATSPANSGNNVLESVGNAFIQNVTADPVYSSDVSNEFYNYKGSLDQANKDKEFRPLPEWYNDSARKKLDKMSKSMSKIRKEMRDIQGNENLDQNSKKDQLRSLQQQINSIAEQGNDYAKQKNIPYK